MPVQPLGPTGLLAQSLTLPAGSQSMSRGGMKMQAQGMDGRKKGAGSHWLSIIGNATENGGAGIAVDGAGNVLVSGLSDSTVLTLKLNADGEPQWANTFSAALNYIPATPADTRMSAATDPAGNLYIVGGQPGVPPALYAAKFGATGSVQLQRSSNGNGFDGADGRRVAISSGGNIYVAGRMFSFTGGTYRCALVKFNPTGGIEWARLIEYAAGLPEDLCGVSLDASENAYVCCASGVSYIAKINAMLSATIYPPPGPTPSSSATTPPETACGRALLGQAQTTPSDRSPWMQPETPMPAAIQTSRARAEQTS
jgi:hypothetical protein